MQASPQTARPATYNEVLLALRQAVEKRPDLDGVVELYGTLLEAEARTEVELCPTAALDKRRASRRLDEGRPLLSPEQVLIDEGKLYSLLAEIRLTIARHRRELVLPLARVDAWLHKQREGIGDLAVEYLREGHLQEAEKAGLPHELVSFVFREALRPFLRAQARTLRPLVNGAQWYRPNCPVCGGQPDFAALQPDSGERLLLCARCDTEWTFRRVACPFCGNDEPPQLAYYPSEDQVYRLTVCERCRRYLKIIDLRQVTGRRVLPAERALTVAMDVAAQRAGYWG
jgi:FdhE protein